MEPEGVDVAGKVGRIRFNSGRMVPFAVVESSTAIMPKGSVSCAVKPPVPASSTACSDCSGEIGISVADVERTCVKGPSPGGWRRSKFETPAFAVPVDLLYIGSQAIAGSVLSGRRKAGPRTERPSMVYCRSACLLVTTSTPNWLARVDRSSSIAPALPLGNGGGGGGWLTARLAISALAAVFLTLFLAAARERGAT